MEKDIIQALSESKTVMQLLMQFLKIKKIDISKFISEGNAEDRLGIFIEFFITMYNIDIVFKPKNIYARKSGKNVVIISTDLPFKDNAYIFVTGLILYCENPF